MNLSLLYKTTQRQYNNFCNFSNEAFDKYQEKRKVLGPVDASLVHYAEAMAYDNAASLTKLLAEINGIPLIERITKYANDVQFDSDRFSNDNVEMKMELRELQEA